jgi:subtilisin family serine protease
MNNTGQTGGTPDADIDAQEAWDTLTASTCIVAVIDTGVDYNHPDLANNIWVNPGEIPGNGKDDDTNGVVDDVHGYDFYAYDSDPMDETDHGTHCSGTIGGIGNNGIGVAGVCWDVKIMALRFLGPGGGFTESAIECVQYGVFMGAKILSNSWGGGPYSHALYDAIMAADAAGVLFVAAAGNSGNDNDIYPEYPASYVAPNIIAVAATTHTDARAYFSCYGRWSVDLGAPGLDILSSIPGNKYEFFDGTSMACPHVAGACALVTAAGYYGFSHDDVRKIILNTVDVIPALNGRTTSGGRLNLNAAVVKAAKGRLLEVLQPNGGEVWYVLSNYPITWDARGPKWAAGDKVYLEYSPDSGWTWYPIAGADSLDYDLGTFNWNTTGLTPTHNYRVRVVYVDDPAVQDMSDSDFVVLPDRHFTITAPNDGQMYEVNQTVPIRWTAWGTDWLPGDLARLEYSFDDGASWQVVQGGAYVPYNQGLLNWNTTGLPGGFCWIRISWIDDPYIYDINDNPVVLRRRFFVNDSSRVNDVYTTAVGNDSNDGMSSNRPKATVQAILDQYDLSLGDIVHIDTGKYRLQNGILVKAQDGGVARGSVTFKGSWKGATLDRGTAASGTSCIYLDNADYVNLVDLVFTNGFYGIALRNADHCALSNITIRAGCNYGVYAYHCMYNRVGGLRVTGARSHGVYLYWSFFNTLEGLDVSGSGGSGLHLWHAYYNYILNSVFRNNSGSGIHNYLNSYAYLWNCTVSGNRGNEIYTSGGGNFLRLWNSIVVADGAGDHCIFANCGRYAGDYNNLWTRNGAKVGYYSDEKTTLTDWQLILPTNAPCEQHSQSADPRFVSSTDLHLRSTAANGTYVSATGLWQSFPELSPSIDAGDPASDFSREPAPNGGRIDQGAYGNTPYASKTP